MASQRKAASILASTVLGALSWSGPAQSRVLKTPYREIAPVEQYRIANREDEIALARSAAPPSISGDAEVLVLGSHGYETAVKGKNGFVCFVQRSWTASFDDPALMRFCFGRPGGRSSPGCGDACADASIRERAAQDLEAESAADVQGSERPGGGVAAGEGFSREMLPSG